MVMGKERETMEHEGRSGRTWMLESPGQRPAAKEPEHLSDVFRQVPLPLLPEQVFLMQHWMSAGPGQ